jgi:aspartate/methionine/tyrosine aminotransferase
VAESGVQPLRVSELVDTTELRAAVFEQELRYPQTNGTAALRETIASMYPGATIDRVQVTNGGSEANCVLLMRPIEPGDEIVFMTPNYLQIAGLARALGATVKPWRANAERGEYRWGVDELERLVTPKTRAICLCNPNNPTGARLGESTLDAICRVAARVGAWVIDDEIYRGAERVAGDTPTVWGRGYDRAIVTSGLSKAYGLPGLRIGWVVASPELISDLWGVHDYTTIAPGAVNDRLAQIALAPPQRERLIARTRTIIRTNYPLVERWIEKQEGLSHIPPAAGAIVFIRHNHPFRSSELAERLRLERSVLVTPGDFFDMDGHLRIGFGCAPRYLESALTLVGEFLASAGAHAR